MRMTGFLSTSQIPDLRKAGNLIVIEVVGFVTLAVTLSRLQIPSGESAAFLCALLFNLLPMYYLARVARAKGKSAVLYGLISLIPAGAIFAYFKLRDHERWH